MRLVPYCNRFSVDLSLEKGFPGVKIVPGVRVS